MYRMISNEQRQYIIDGEAAGVAYRNMLIHQILVGMREMIEDADIVNQFRRALFNQRKPYVDLTWPLFWDAQNLESDARLDINEMLEWCNGYDQLANQFDYIDIAHEVDAADELIRLRVWFKPDKEPNGEWEEDLLDIEEDQTRPASPLCPTVSSPSPSAPLPPPQAPGRPPSLGLWSREVRSMSFEEMGPD